jgi:hypothetical protein
VKSKSLVQKARKKQSNANWYEKNKELVSQQGYAWRAANRDKIRNRRLRHTHGISLDDYNNMLDSQHGCCAICHKSGKLVVDHEHKSGKVRALLCNHRNLVLGHSLENINTLIMAVNYLEKHK